MGKKFVSMLGEQSGRMTAMGLLVTVMFTMVLAGALSSTANAATISVVSDTLSVSAPSSASNHTIVFTAPNAVAAGGSVSYAFNAAFDTTTLNGASDFEVEVNNVALTEQFGGACGTGVAKISVAADVVTVGLCTTAIGAGQVIELKIGTHTAAVGDSQIVNPSTANVSYDLDISTKDSAGTTVDTGGTWLAIVNTVLLTADVDSYFDFVIQASASGAVADGITSTVTTTLTTCNFGTLSTTASASCIQELHARTNAASGYVVTVEQNHNMLASSGADIDAFANGTPSSGAAWSSPTAVNGNADTYGHLGLYSTDNVAAGLSASNSYFGLNGTTQKTVLSHGSPTTGSDYTGWNGITVDGVNHANMVYTVEVSDLQEPGHYASRLMYIGTATF